MANDDVRRAVDPTPVSNVSGSEPVKPLLATRFKLSFDGKGRCTTFRKDQADALEGGWVWLIEATNGMNDPLFVAPKVSPSSKVDVMKARRIIGDLVGHARFVEANFNVAYAHLHEAEAFLDSSPSSKVLTVIDPQDWEPCSPAYLSNGGCCDHVRLWCEAEKNHYHPRKRVVAKEGE